jgi:hypothetical protein
VYTLDSCTVTFTQYLGADSTAPLLSAACDAGSMDVYRCPTSTSQLVVSLGSPLTGDGPCPSADQISNLCIAAYMAANPPPTMPAPSQDTTYVGGACCAPPPSAASCEYAANANGGCTVVNDYCGLTLEPNPTREDPFPAIDEFGQRIPPYCTCDCVVPDLGGAPPPPDDSGGSSSGGGSSGGGGSSSGGGN